jgi:hypothetical protein
MVSTMKKPLHWHSGKRRGGIAKNNDLKFEVVLIGYNCLNELVMKIQIALHLCNKGP